jgi:hypothetical protein
VVGEQSVAQDPVGDVPGILVEQIGNDDLVVVVGGAGERSLTAQV